MSLPFLSVVIPAFNRPVDLQKCLELLKPGAQTLESGLYEVIVTDDSTNNENQILIETQYGFVKHVKGLRKGPAANRNNGARSAKAEWLVFTDDDCLPESDWLETFYKAILKNPDCKAFEGAIHATDWEALKEDMAECPVNTEGGCFWSANIMVQKTLFFDIGGFDETYLLAAQEDQQMQLDVLNRTGIIFIRECIVKHPIRKVNMWQSVRKIPIRSMNFSLYASKNKETLGYVSILGFTVSQYRQHLASAFGFLKKGALQSLFLSLNWLTWGVPLNTWNFYNISKENS